VLFSEEKIQKTFASALAERSRPWPDTWGGGGIKVFCFFSSEKKSLPYRIDLPAGPVFIPQCHFGPWLSVPLAEHAALLHVVWACGR
jgi:hypothetical protein